MNFEHWLQSRLTAHGLAVGPIDGIIGPITTAALKSFQWHAGLESTGRADAETVRALRASSSHVPPRDLKGIPDRDKDPKTSPSGYSQFPRQKDMANFYGPHGTGTVLVEVPFDMYLAWDTGTKIRRISIHAKAADSCKEALEEIASVYSENDRIDLGVHLFGGSFNVRQVRGGTRLSTHAWGAAIDFDPLRNRLKWGKDRARLARSDAEMFWKAWERRGWVSLGRARNFDWMHVQAARL